MKGLIKTLMLSLLFLFAACSGEQGGDNTSASGGQDNPGGLTDFEMKHGIGPVNEAVSLNGEIDQEMVTTGKEIFKTKCSACHKMEDNYVGPPLGDVLDKRTPAYVMNMILNPVEMTKKHPDAKKMLAQYMNQMTFQNVTRDQARAIVEYLRTENQSEENVEG
ncbi:MAG: cytochrome c [Balneolaceae bacterium]|nr:cytochrome c [Balneolaceae bacterium]